MNDFLQSLRNGQAEKQRTPKTRKNFDNSYHYTSPPRFQSYGGYQNNRNQHMKRPPSQQPPGNQLPMDDNSTMMLAEAIENLNNHIETLVKNQDYLINAQEKTADMVERQAIAIERIVAHLDIAPAHETEPEEEIGPQKTFEHHYVTPRKQEPEIAEPVETFEKPAARAKTKPPLKAKTPVKAKSPAKAPVKETIEKAKPVKSITRKRKKIVEKKSAKPVSTAGKEKKLLSRDAIMDIIQTMRTEGATFDQVASRLVELGQPTFSGRGEWHAQTIHRLCNKK